MLSFVVSLWDQAILQTIGIIRKHYLIYRQLADQNSIFCRHWLLEAAVGQSTLYFPRVRARICKLQKKGALDSQLQVMKFTSCLPMVGGSHRVLRLLPPLKLIAMI